MNEEAKAEVLDRLSALRDELLQAISGERYSTVELGVNAKGDATWIVKVRDEDVNWAAFTAERLHEHFALRFNRGRPVGEPLPSPDADGNEPAPRTAGDDAVDDFDQRVFGNRAEQEAFAHAAGLSTDDDQAF